MALGPVELTRRRFLAGSAAAIAAARSTAMWGADAAVMEVPKPAALETVSAGGELGRRMQQNFARLQDAIYRPPLLFRQTNWQSWPGDFEGRALLADVLLSRATGHTPEYLPAMVAAYPPQLNRQGYFGPLLDVKAINEQQLSGHGWYLRGLCEYYEWRREPATLEQIRKIIRNLALPLRGKYATYPIDPAVRTRAVAPNSPGAVDGHLNAQHGDWALSSDTGCAFIFLDGLAHAWVVLRAAGAPEAAVLKALIDEAAARFIAMDVVAVKAQTHATLTGVRALLRVHAHAGDGGLLSAARDRYGVYRATGMTEHYANTNWFGRPDTWTEPCAIIDSYVVAVQLWQHTGEPAYLEDAHRIWFNGVGRGLRGNGGFGTDTCVDTRSPWLRVRSYEAYFCCTMRGGEGHARAAQYLYFTRPGELTVTNYENSLAEADLGHGNIKLRQTTQYPYSGKVRMEVLSATAGSPVSLRLFAPQWASNQRVMLNGQPLSASATNGFLVARFTPRAGEVLELDQKLRVAPRSPMTTGAPQGAFAFEAGPLVLGYKPQTWAAGSLRAPDPAEIHLRRDAALEPTGTPGEYRVASTGLKLGRINDLNDTHAADTDPCPRQILFRET